MQLRKLLAAGSMSQAEMDSVKSTLWKEHEEALSVGSSIMAESEL